jgi:hypothetical protein
MEWIFRRPARSDWNESGVERSPRVAGHQLFSCRSNGPAILKSERVITSGDTATFLKDVLWMPDTMVDTN